MHILISQNISPIGSIHEKQNIMNLYSEATCYLHSLNA